MPKISALPSDASLSGTELVPTAQGGTTSGATVNQIAAFAVASDAELAAIAGLTSAADRVPYFTGSGTAALATFTAAGRALVDDADATAQRVTLGLVIGTNVQAYDALLLSIAGLTFGADSYIYGTGSDTAAAGTITSFGRSLIDDADAATALTTLGVSAFAQTILDDANAGAAQSTLGLGTVAVLDETTTAQYRANTADKALSTDQVWGAAAPVALTPGTNVSVDMSTGFNFTLAMGGNYTLDNPTNVKDQQGYIQITQDGTGSRTLAYGSNWKFAGGTDPVLSTAAGAIDVLFYQVLSSTVIVANLVKAIA